MSSGIRHFRELFRLFHQRFFENDEAAPESNLATNVYQVLGILIVPGLFTALVAGPLFEQLANLPPGPILDWAIRTSLLFFPAYSFAVTGFATLFEWDMLFPDRRDFLILAVFPFRVRHLFAAKLAALSVLLLLLFVAINGIPIVLIPLFASQVGQLREAGIPSLLLAQLAATGAASGFAFFAVAGLQGLLVSLTSPRIFRLISPWVQMCGMSTMVLSLILFPLYAPFIRTIAENHAQWLWYFPPYWFGSIYELLLPRAEPVFAALGRFAFKALGVAIVIFGFSWTVGFRRHYRRTLEWEAPPRLVPRTPVRDWFSMSPVQRGVYYFSRAVLARSNKHRLFLATYLSVGVAFGLLVTVAVREGSIAVSPQGLRALPFLLVFFVVSGFRAAFQFPSELAANWIFRIAEDRWGEQARKTARQHVFIGGLLPVALLFVPVEIVYWGWLAGLFHFGCQLLTGMLLIEVLFWNFDKVPFTCSYFPGKVHLALLAGLYLYGFTTYSFQMAYLEAASEAHWPHAALFLLAVTMALALLWSRRPESAAVRFDGDELGIQGIDLT